MEDFNLMCFKHCSVDVRLFYIREKTSLVFQRCPVCGHAIGRRVRCCLTIKPSTCSFQEYKSSESELHIGVSNSKGHIYHYDQDGLHCDSDPLCTYWTHCLVVPCSELGVDEVTESFMSSMDCSEWMAAFYHRDSHNCYDFTVAVLNFIVKSSSSRSSHGFWTKDSVCRYVLPHTRCVAQYLDVITRANEIGICPVKS
ncbi:MKRN2 opposite strand protein-like isoform X2 [Corticium candelabrum]|uniref:MKRN2 opposite strand protein-like isoform X2 n=1 Tax=Corticium candelabrum TaxID=121492 RepID=UPI002E252C18|nr:MKRN2 opposite strand protein-like isoform X2 [Corticium candelabrum]